MSRIVCRACLAGDIRVDIITEVRLLEIYRKLTNIKVQDGMAYPLCYLCKWQLLKCQSFVDMALRSDRILKSIVHSNVKVCKSTVVNMLNLARIQRLVVTKQRPISLDGSTNTESYSTCKKRDIKQTELPVIQGSRTNLPVKVDTRTHLPVKIEAQIKSPVSRTNETLTEVKQETLTVTEFLKIQNELRVDSNDKIEKTPKGKQLSNRIAGTPRLDTDQLNINFSNQPVPGKPLRLILQPGTSFDVLKIPNRNTKEIQIKKKTVMKTNNPKIQANIQVKKVKVKSEEHLAKLNPMPLKIVETEESKYCRICDKYINQKGKMIDHMRTHTGEKPFMCDKCGHKSRMLEHLKAHMAVHSGTPAFTCKICNKDFRHKCNFNYHMNIHTGERPFSCHICGKAYKQSGQVKEHIRRLHERKTRFTCNECGKKFNIKLDLRRHLVSHSTVKAVSCNHCCKTFTTKFVLKRHIKKYCKNVPSQIKK